MASPIKPIGAIGAICQQQRNALIQSRYREIYAHEQAHKAAAGSFGGAIVIEKNSEGIPVGGHVNIKMPKLNKANPEETIKHANTVIKAALAPNDPSSQDIKVAGEAKAIKQQATAEKQKQSVGSRLNYYA